jgi:uncharacterized protein
LEAVDVLARHALERDWLWQVPVGRGVVRAGTAEPGEAVPSRMRDAELQSLLSWLRGRLTDLYRDRLVHVLLYGSHARGEARADSDVDVAIVLSGSVNAPDEIGRTANLVADAVLTFGRFVSIYPLSEVDYRAADRAIIRAVLDEGTPAR